MTSLKSFLGAVLMATSVASAAEPTVRPLALEEADSYREQARYPSSSHPIRDAIDPILAGRAISKQILPGPNGEGPSLAVWNSAISYELGEKVLLYAELRDAEPTASKLGEFLDHPRRNIAREITAKIVGEDSGPIGEVSYHDNSQGDDRIRGDGIYTASFDMPSVRAPLPGFAESVAVHVQALTDKGDPRDALGGLLFSNRGARLTGRFKDAMRDGNMVIGAEVEVLAPGRYHLAVTPVSTLVGGMAERPMAWAQNAKDMQTGKQWRELSYYGLIFRDMAATGPLNLRSITLTSALGMPNAMTSVQQDVFQTHPHALTEFLAQPFGDAGLLQTAERLERVETN